MQQARIDWLLGKEAVARAAYACPAFFLLLSDASKGREGLK
jgi:hypothetical protein